MGVFPQYARETFHFTTESYGGEDPWGNHYRCVSIELTPGPGHYGPVFSEYIESQNAKAISGAHKISLSESPTRRCHSLLTRYLYR